MGWSRVSRQHKKPLRWWLHKLLCELGWAIGSCSSYQYHLIKMVEIGYDLQGNSINNRK